MKLTLAQAFATVLRVQVVPFRAGHPELIFAMRIGGPDGIEQQLGVVGEITLEQAVVKAMELCSFSQECHFAIFPIESNRENYYMEIEREMLRQEAMSEMEGHKAWEIYGNDPRNCVTAGMEALRECSRTITLPQQFRKNFIRVACIVIATLQWIDEWIRKLTLSAQKPDIVTPFRPQDPPDSLECNILPE